MVYLEALGLQQQNTTLIHCYLSSCANDKILLLPGEDAKGHQNKGHFPKIVRLEMKELQSKLPADPKHSASPVTLTDVSMMS